MAPPLLVTQQDDVFEALKTVGLEPLEFEWVKRRGWYSESPAPCLRHKPTGYYFLFDFGSAGGGHRYSPAQDMPYADVSVDGWPETRLHVVVWAQSVHREYTAPNLWAQLDSQRELFSGEPSDEENKPFTAEELARVDASLAEVLELVQANYEVTPEQVEQLNRRIGYLQAAARRVGRVDWLNIVLAAIVQLVFQSVLSSDAAQDVTSFIQRSLSTLFDHLRGLPGPPT